MESFAYFWLWILCAVVSACIAACKGRNWWIRLIVGLAIGPFGLLIGLLPARFNRPVSLSPRLLVVCAVVAWCMSLGGLYSLYIGAWWNAAILITATGLMAQAVFLHDHQDAGAESDDSNPPSLNNRPR